MPQINFTCFRLKFSSPLHLSVGKNDYDVGQTTLHSDALKAAIFACAMQLGASEQEAYAMNEGYRASSAFPFFGAELFFPKPSSRLPQIVDVDEFSQGKALKKIRYIGQSFFEDILSGNPQKQLLQSIHLHDGDQYLSDHADLQGMREKIVYSAVNQRVTIYPDYHQPPTPFYTERLFFHDRAGLFFLVQWQAEESRDLFVKALRLLGDNGIGTDRNVGNGFFSIQSEEEISFNTPASAAFQMNLSLYCPEAEECTNEVLQESSYQLIKRGGYMAAPETASNVSLRKRSVYMFDVGSCFPAHVKLSGKQVNLRPEISLVTHEVWRDGRAIFLPINPIPAS